MRFLVDTNVLVAATMRDLAPHETCKRFLLSVLERNDHWCLTWTNVYEYLRVTTHARIFPRPLSFQQAYDQVNVFLSHPFLEILLETARHADVLTEIVADAQPVSGNFLHDCRIATLAVEHGVREIVTMDSHFRRFGKHLNVVSPEDRTP